MTGFKKQIIYWISLFIFILISTADIKAGMAFDSVVTRVRDAGDYVDYNRFPASLLYRTINDMTTMIATYSNTYEKTDTIPIPTADSNHFDLSSDFYLYNVSYRNADPDLGEDENNERKKLKYVPRNEFKAFTPVIGRPGQCTIWGRQIYIDKISQNIKDTIFVDYWAYPPKMELGTDTVMLPPVYIPLLQAYVLQQCYSKISHAIDPNVIARLDQLVKALEVKIYGRPKDEL